MKVHTLGNTGLNVSVVGIGTWQFGGEWGKESSQEEVDAIFGRAGELGINLIDTAECYCDHLSERLVGRAIAGRRDEWIRRDEVPEDVPMATWALAWCSRHPAVTCVIPGCKSVEQVKANAAAAALAPAEHPQARGGSRSSAM